MTEAPTAPPPNLRHQAIQGTLWSGVSQVGVQVISLVATAILARLLSPNEFGLLGMAAIFIGIGQQLNELGLTAALVQRQDLSPEHVSTSFWAAMAVSLVITLLMIVLAPWVAAYFHEPRVVGVLRVISIDFLLVAASNAPRALLQRQMRFRGLATGQLAGNIAYGVVAVLVAWQGGGVYALVAGQIANDFVNTVILWQVAGWWPRLAFSWTRFRELSRFSVNMMLGTIINYASSNVDFLLVGRHLGPGPLGIYSQAYNMATLPQRKIARLLLQVLFPAFSRLQDETARLRTAFLKSQNILAVIVFPMLLGLTLTARDFILVVLGAKWHEAVMPLQILCLAGLILTLSSGTAGLILARGRSDLHLFFSIVRLVLVTIAVLIGIRFGTVGVSCGIAAFAVIHLLMYPWFVLPLADIRIGQYLGALGPAAGSSLVMAGAVSGFGLLPFARELPDIVRLVLAVGIGGVVYVAAVRLLFRTTWDEILSLVMPMIPRRARP